MSTGVLSYVGAFTKRTGTGTQSITGVGFQPKAVFFWWNNVSANGLNNAGARMSFGFDDGTNHFGVAHSSQDNAATSDTSRGYHATKSLILYNLDETTDSLGSISAMGADGFTVDWTTVTGSANVLIQFIAFGGTQVSAHAGAFTSRSGTGTQSVTGVGFRPTALISAQGLWTTITAVGDGFGGASLGAATDDGQWSVTGDSVDNVNPSQTTRQQVQTLFVNKNPSTGNVHQASLTSLDSDGFTVNWSVNAVQGQVPYLALRGFVTQIGTITEPLTTGTQAIACQNILPKSVLFASVGAATSTSRSSQNRLSVGASDGTSQFVAWTGDENAVSPTQGGRYRSATEVMVAVDTIPATATSATLVSSLSVTGFALGSVDLDWGTVSGTAREVTYILFGSHQYSLSIDAIDRNPLLETFNIQAPLNGIATMRADFETEGGSPIFMPNLDDEIIMTEFGTPIFGGYVTAVRLRGFGGPNGEAVVAEVTAQDYKIATKRRLVNESVTGTGLVLKDILQALEPYLTPYGITLDPAQVDGPSVDPVFYEDRELKGILDELSVLTGYVWDIDVYKVFRMYAIGTYAVPFDIDDSDLPAKYFGDISVEPTREQYANRILYRFGPDGNVETTDTFFGDGVTTTFTLSAPLTNYAAGVYVARGYVTSDASVSPAINETLSLTGEGGDWEFDPVANTITRTLGAPSGTAIIQIIYVGRFPVTVTVSDAGEISTHGLFEFLVRDKATTSLTLATALANAELQKHLTVLQRVTYATREVTVFPGMTQNLFVPLRNNLNIAAVITEVVIESEPGGDLLVRRVTALEGDAVQGDWRDVYRQWIA